MFVFLYLSLLVVPVFSQDTLIDDDIDCQFLTAGTSGRLGECFGRNLALRHKVDYLYQQNEAHRENALSSEKRLMAAQDNIGKELESCKNHITSVEAFYRNLTEYYEKELLQLVQSSKIQQSTIHSLQNEIAFRRAESPWPDDGKVRLVNSTTIREGRVEISFAGLWGTVCDDEWTDRTAEVVCRQLGFAGGVVRRMERFGRGSGGILLDDVTCTGSESSLVECAHRPWGVI